MSSQMNITEFTQKLLEHAPLFEKQVLAMVSARGIADQVLPVPFEEWIQWFSDWMMNGAPEYNEGEDTGQ